MSIERGYIFKPEEPSEIQDSVQIEICESRIELEYCDNTTFPLEINKIDILLGVFNGLGEITMLDCRLSGATMGGGANIKKYIVTYILKGVHIYSLRDLKFSKCIINIPSLYEWVKINSIKNKFWSEGKIYFDIPNDIKLCLLEKFKLLLSFENKIRCEKNEILIKQFVNLKIVSVKECFEISEFLEVINHFKKFLLFIANKSPVSESIILFNPKFKNDVGEHLIPINLLTKHDSTNIQLNHSAINVDFLQFEKNFEEIIKNWYENSNLNSSVDLIIEKLINPRLSRENDFLNACFSIETYHRRFRNIEVLDKKEFKKIRNNILCNINDEEIKKFIKEKLAFANEPTFRARLNDLKKYFENILPSDINVNDYIVKIVKTRNYLVHRGDNRNILDSFDLFYAARFIECIIRICILEELKGSQSLIHKIQTYDKNYLGDIYKMNRELKKLSSKSIFSK